MDVFDQMNQLLLILGEPGSGKTTRLLELLEALLMRAETDPMHPTPVVFNLSSWAEKRPPLEEWLVDELRTKYSIPKKVAQGWVKGDELLLLLDGLDEVRPKYREECVKTINTFRQEHLVPLAVCSRLAEYEDLTTKLKLQGAVLVQPLTLPQINDYLDTIGAELSAVRTTIQQDTEFQELATSPLMLSIMVLAYEGVSTGELSPSNSLQTHRQHIFDTYIRRIFAHRDTPHTYPIQKTIYWLSWLAANMSQHQQTIFLIERMQPNLLQIPARIRSYRLVGGLIFGLVVWLLVVLIFGLLGGLFGGLVFGLLSGLCGALIFGLVYGWGDIKPAEKLEFDKGRLIVGLVGGPILVLVFNLVGGLILGPGNDGLAHDLVFGLGIGLTYSLKLKEISQTTYPNQGIWHSVRNVLVLGLLGGLIFELVFGPLSGLVFGLSIGLGVGGRASIKHCALRFLLWKHNHVPLNYARFLDYCHEHIFLHKVGGGYSFIHRMLLEHFASLTEEDVQRLSTEQ